MIKLTKPRTRMEMCSMLLHLSMILARVTPMVWPCHHVFTSNLNLLTVGRWGISFFTVSSDGNCNFVSIIELCNWKNISTMNFANILHSVHNEDTQKIHMLHYKINKITCSQQDNKTKDFFMLLPHARIWCAFILNILLVDTHAF